MHLSVSTWTRSDPDCNYGVDFISIRVLIQKWICNSGNGIFSPWRQHQIFLFLLNNNFICVFSAWKVVFEKALW